MKKIALLLMIASISTTAMATEPLLLEPLSPAVLDGTDYQVEQPTAQQQPVYVKNANGVYEAVYTPKFAENMVPQNAAAEGKPVPERRMPRIRIKTKQGSQTNTQWNPGGKGTKSYF